MTSYRPMTASDLPTLTFDVGSDVFDTRQRGEFGQVIEGFAFSVRATAPSGLRWRSECFATKVEFTPEDGFPFSEGHRRAQDKAERLLARVGRDRALALSWKPTDPVYGSASWGRDAEWNQMDSEELEGRFQRGY